MANQWPAPTYVDGDFTTAQPCGLPVFYSPVPATTAEYCFRQDFMQFRANASATALGTAHPSSGKTPDYSAWLLVNEGDKQDIGLGICKWTRTYAKVPDSHNEWETFAYSFIGTAPEGYSIAADVVGRLRRTELVTSRVQHDYFYVNPSLGSDAPPIYKSAGNIPSYPEFRYLMQFLDGSTQYGGIANGTDYVSDDFVNSTAGYLFPSIPSLTDYNQQILDAQTNGWSAGVSYQKYTTSAPVIIDITGKVVYPSSPPTFGTVTALFGQIAAEPSRIERWLGNIFVRRTRYILAK